MDDFSTDDATDARGKRAPISRQVKLAVLKRAGYACEKCGRPQEMDDGTRSELHLHHRHRVDAGGNDDPHNLNVLCDRCHREWHHVFEGNELTFTEWLLCPPAAHLVLLFTATDWPEDESAQDFQTAILTGYYDRQTRMDAWKEIARLKAELAHQRMEWRQQIDRECKHAEL